MYCVAFCFTVLEISLEFLLGLGVFVLLAVFRALAKLRDWFCQIARLVQPAGVAGAGGVNCGVFINLVCLPAKGSSTEDPKMSFKHVLFKGIHTVFFWGRAGSRPDFGISV